MLTVTYTGTERFALDRAALQELCRRRPTLAIPRSSSPASDDGAAAAVLCAAATGEQCIEVPRDLELDIVGDDDQIGPGLWIAVRPRAQAIRVAGPWQPLKHFQPAPATSRTITAADEAEQLLEAVVTYANHLLRPLAPTTAVAADPRTSECAGTRAPAHTSGFAVDQTQLAEVLQAHLGPRGKAVEDAKLSWFGDDVARALGALTALAWSGPGCIRRDPALHSTSLETYALRTEEEFIVALRRADPAGAVQIASDSLDAPGLVLDVIGEHGMALIEGAISAVLREANRLLPALELLNEAQRSSRC